MILTASVLGAAPRMPSLARRMSLARTPARTSVYGRSRGDEDTLSVFVFIPLALAVYNVSMNRCRDFVVSGRVQGVFFRAATEDTARRLGLTGWVRNLPDGSVELVACGDESKLKELERWLWQGPPRARVEQVKSLEAEPQTFSDFSVRG